MIMVAGLTKMMWMARILCLQLVFSLKTKMKIRILVMLNIHVRPIYYVYIYSIIGNLNSQTNVAIIGSAVKYRI